MYYLQPQFPPPCGPLCSGCRLCCDVVLCDEISASESENNSRNSSAKRLIEALEEVNATSVNSESSAVQRYQKSTSFHDKSISTEDRKSLSEPNDSKELMNLCLTMMKEIKEVRDSLKYPPKRVCNNCHSSHWDSQQTFASTTSCSKCKRIIRCYRNPQCSYSRGTSCYFKTRKNFYHPSDNQPRAYPRRREPTSEEIQNTWCCWPFF